MMPCCGRASVPAERPAALPVARCGAILLSGARKGEACGRNLPCNIKGHAGKASAPQAEPAVANAGAAATAPSCTRCGRRSHDASMCYASTHSSGAPIAQRVEPAAAGAGASAAAGAASVSTELPCR